MEIFNPDKIVDGYRQEDIISLPDDQRLDFLPREKIRKSSPLDKRILESWQEYFTSKDVPWAVTEAAGCLILWKEKVS